MVTKRKPAFALNRMFVNLDIGKKLATILAGGCCLGTATALAEGPDWTYVEAGYADARIYSYNVASIPGWPDKLSSDGFALSGSLLLGENFLLSASYLDLSKTIVSGFAEFESSVIALGVGWRATLNESTDYFAIASFLKAEGRLTGSDISVPKDDPEGYSVSFGLRRVFNQFDLRASLDYRDFGSQSLVDTFSVAFDDNGGIGSDHDPRGLGQLDGSAFSLGLDAHYIFREHFGAGVNLRVTEDGTDWIAGIRAYF